MPDSSPNVVILNIYSNMIASAPSTVVLKEFPAMRRIHLEHTHSLRLEDVNGGSYYAVYAT